MHSALRIQEILLIIFRHVHADMGSIHQQCPSRATLASLARTCHDFLEPALDILWLSMTSLVPLIKCLPENTTHLVHENTGFYTLPILNIYDTIRDRDFDRLLYYASRIKTLRFTGQGPYPPRFRLDNETYEALLLHKPISGMILPNVRHLEIELFTFAKSAALPRLLLGPRIKVLHLSGGMEIDPGGEEWTNVATIFNQVVSKSGITELTLDIYYGHEAAYNPRILEPVAFSFSILNQFVQLRNLNIETFNLDNSGVAQLGLMAGLEVLAMSFVTNTEGPIPIRLPVAPDGYFRTLRKLQISISDTTVISSLLKQWNASKLESMTIERVDPRVAWDLEGLFWTMGQHLSPTALKHLELKNYMIAAVAEAYPYNRNISHLSYAAVKNLFCFRELVHLSIKIGARVVFDDFVLHKIAASFPKLDHLEFYEREFSVPSLITPSAMYTLVESLPDLRHLTLRFNATMEFPDKESMLPQKLRSLDVSTSEATDANRISHFLSTVFPSLEFLGWGWVYDHPFGGRPLQYHTTPEEYAHAENFERCWQTVFRRLPQCEKLDD